MTFVRGRHESLIDILKQSRHRRRSAVSSPISASRRCSSTTRRAGSRSVSTGRSTCAWAPRGRSAADLVNTLDEYELTRIIRDYGEEPMARRIARAIVAARERSADRDDHDALAEVIRSVKKPRSTRDRSVDAHVPGAAHRHERGADRARSVRRRRGERARDRRARRRSSRFTRSRIGSSSARSAGWKASAPVRRTCRSAVAARRRW